MGPSGTAPDSGEGRAPASPGARAEVTRAAAHLLLAHNQPSGLFWFLHQSGSGFATAFSKACSLQHESQEMPPSTIMSCGHLKPGDAGQDVPLGSPPCVSAAYGLGAPPPRRSRLFTLRRSFQKVSLPRAPLVGGRNGVGAGGWPGVLSITQGLKS